MNAEGAGAGTGVGTAGSCQPVLPNAAIAAWVAGEGPCAGSTENGEAAIGCAGATAKGELTGADKGGATSKGEAALTGASKPNPSAGSATWKGESGFLRSGTFAGRPGSTCLASAASSTTMKGDSWRATAANGLETGGTSAGSWTTAKGESWAEAGWLGKVSKIPRFVLMAMWEMRRQGVDGRAGAAMHHHTNGKLNQGGKSGFPPIYSALLTFI